MDVITDTTKLNGFFKNKYTKKLIDAIPESAKFSGQIPFSKAEKIGNAYKVPVELAMEAGVTYAAAGAGAFDLEDAEAGEMKEASVDGSQYLIKGMIDYEAAAKAVAEGEEAFGNSGGRLVKRMTKAIYKRIELSALYGGTSLATVSSNVGGGIIAITTATWATGIWVGMRNSKLDCYDTIAYGTQRNSVGALKISFINVSARRLTLTGDAGDLSAIGAGDVLVFRGAADNEMAGLDKIVTNTGLLFGINAATYELWAGNTYALGSVALTLARLNQAIADAVGKGLDEKATVFVNPRTWGNLMSDQAALRKYDARYESGKSTNGFRSLVMYSQNGELEIVPHTMIKEGEAFVIPLDRWKKVGATDVTAQVPGRGDEFFKHMEAKAGYELRMYANLAVFCEAPGFCTKITGIVNA
jgi:hypothetical protein